MRGSIGALKTAGGALAYATGTALGVALVADDVTGVGVLDDPALALVGLLYAAGTGAMISAASDFAMAVAPPAPTLAPTIPDIPSPAPTPTIPLVDESTSQGRQDKDRRPTTQQPNTNPPTTEPPIDTGDPSNPGGPNPPKFTGGPMLKVAIGLGLAAGTAYLYNSMFDEIGVPPTTTSLDPVFPPSPNASPGLYAVDSGLKGH